MNLNEYMKKTGVTKKKYVDNWIDLKIIPGACRNETTGEYFFLNSSRRPYKNREALKPTSKADKIRAHVVKAALLR